MDQKNFAYLQKINQHWDDVLTNLFFLNKVNSHKVKGNVNPYIAKLALLPVSKKSIFSDMLWDYSEETRNRAASVTPFYVKLNFESYKYIPLGVITELKCLFLNIYSSPKDFGHRKNEVKPNTIINLFHSGLSFINYTFKEMELRLGKEYVRCNCNKVSDITLLDFEVAVKKTTLLISSKKKPDNNYKYFFDYLNNDKAKESIGIECHADFNFLKEEYEKSHNGTNVINGSKLPYLETKYFNLALKKASFNIVSFLYAIGENVNDPVISKYYDLLSTAYETFPFTKQEFENYGAYRLNKSGYSFYDINRAFPDHQRTKAGSVEDLRVATRDVYYSALWVIASLMGARPNVYADLKIDSCLDLKTNTIVAEEHKGRDNRWNLFNDRWVAIPIMVDALKVIELIGGKIFRNKYVFGNIFTSPPGEITPPMTSLVSIIQQTFIVLTGLSPKDINSKLNGYVFRHSLSHEMYRADVGLPVISYQLKHIVTATDALARKGKVSKTTLGYGGIANKLTSTESKLLDIKHIAELEAVKENFDPNGKYMGGKADEHLSKVKKFFNGCIEAGYTEEEIYEAMVKQGLAIINVGSGYCFGGAEDFDDSLPCIGGLRCNPVRCSNAVVTKANAPKWREIYLSNLKLMGTKGYEDRQDQIVEAIEESKRVLEYLGEELI